MKNNAQANAIKIRPEYSQGYLMLDKAASSNAHTWDIKIGVKQSTFEDGYRLGGINLIYN